MHVQLHWLLAKAGIEQKVASLRLPVSGFVAQHHPTFPRPSSDTFIQTTTSTGSCFKTFSFCRDLDRGPRVYSHPQVDIVMPSPYARLT